MSPRKQGLTNTRTRHKSGLSQPQTELKQTTNNVYLNTETVRGRERERQRGRERERYIEGEQEKKRKRDRERKRDRA